MIVENRITGFFLPSYKPQFGKQKTGTRTIKPGYLYFASALGLEN